jgi:hypothetical protein
MTGTTELTTWGGVASGAEEGMLEAMGNSGCCTVEDDDSGGVSVDEVLDVGIIGSREGEEDDMVFGC